MAQRSFQVAVVDTCHCKRNFRKFRDFFKQANDRIGCKLFTCDVYIFMNLWKKLKNFSLLEICVDKDFYVEWMNKYDTFDVTFF